MPYVKTPNKTSNRNQRVQLANLSPVLTASLVGKLLDDTYDINAKGHTGKLVRISHWTGHKIHGQIESVKHKVYNEKALTALSVTITVPLLALSATSSAFIVASTKGIATPLALGALAVGTWAASQVADAVTELARNQFRQERMRTWFKDYPIARREIEHQGQRLQLMTDACDSIRRAVDHYKKANDAAAELGQVITQTDFGNFTNCSELVGTTKKFMHFIHEMQKTERYLAPGIDLAILLRNTQAQMCDQLTAVVQASGNVLADYFVNGDHSKCDVCYASVNHTDVQRNPINHGQAALSPGVYHYGERAEALRAEVERLIDLRDDYLQDLALGSAPPKPGDPSARQRYAHLLADAAKHYDKPGIIRRTAHYVNNYRTRNTAGEHFIQVFSRGLSLGVGVGSAIGGGFFNAGVIQPMVEAPIKAGAKIAPSLVASLATTSIKQSIGATVKAGKLGTNLTAKFITGKVEGIESEDVANDKHIKRSGKKVGDDLFKKVARHMKQAADVMEKLQTLSFRLDTCASAVDFGRHVGEYTWHLDKSIRYLTHCIRMLDHMAHGVKEWAAVEQQIWHALEGAAVDYLAMSYRSCSCNDKRLGASSFKACYAPGNQLSEPKRRL